MVQDGWLLYDLAMKKSPITGLCTEENRVSFRNVYGKAEVGKYYTYDMLVEVVKNRLKQFIGNDLFYGIRLSDEPTFENLNQTAITYRAIKDGFKLAKQELEAEGVRVFAEDIFVQVCLWGYNEGQYSSYKYTGTKTDSEEIYREYLETYLNVSKATELIFDSYPMHENGVHSSHLKCLKIIADVAKKYGVNIGGVAGSCQLYSAIDTPWVKAPDAEDMYYQLNLYAMFGAKSIGYYTYWSSVNGQLAPDGTAFINRDGSKNDLYYTMQDINAQLQKLGNAVLGYDYNAVKKYGSAGALSVITDSVDSFAKLNVTAYTGRALVTELTQKASGNYLYSVFNTEAPQNGTANEGKDITVTLDFADEYSKVQVYFLGSNGSASGSALSSDYCTILDIADGQVSLTLSAGSAAYLVPMA